MVYYRSMQWLRERQVAIEQRLSRATRKRNTAIIQLVSIQTLEKYLSILTLLPAGAFVCSIIDIVSVLSWPCWLLYRAGTQVIYTVSISAAYLSLSIISINVSRIFF